MTQNSRADNPNRQGTDPEIRVVPAEYEHLTADEAQQLLAEASDAVADMAAREKRRDATYQTTGDDRDPQIEEQLDANAPKAADVD